MTRSLVDPRDLLSCPNDLCCHGECHCAPSGAGPVAPAAVRAALARLFRQARRGRPRPGPNEADR